ncbi:MAG: DEAD/DEAH box helicase [Bacillota bacterium]|nr:DEAD/DEAH box helicase [Bacillota bacterium]
MNFNELPLRPEILRAVEEIGYDEPTEIQVKAIPAVLAGKDVTGRSSTGTGKTAAFGIPLVQLTAETEGRAIALVLSPTRELAMQIAGEIRKFGKYLPGISIATIYGGQSMELQIRDLKKAKIVIGTPGRIMDHMRRRTLRLDNLSTVVLDEADEMLNMGFIDDIETILSETPEERQTLLFSATMPPAIADISKRFQNQPLVIKTDRGKRTVASIDQSYYNIPQAGKVDALKLLLEYHRPKRALIFCNTKRMVDDLAEALNKSGFKAAAIHGDMRQAQRTSVMNEFKSGRSNILIATDVAARGIDVEDVEAVFNFDIPQEYEYYIHRIGRTGRAGKEGAAYTLAANRNQVERVREIERYIAAPIVEKAVPSLENISARRMDSFAEEIISLIDEGIDEGWHDFVTDLTEKGYAPEDVAAALCGRAQKKNQRLAAVRNVASFGGRRQGQAASGRRWIRVNIGSASKIGPNFIVGAIVDATGIQASKIGKINIFSDHTDIELSERDAKMVIDNTGDLRIKGKAVCFTWAEPGLKPKTKRQGQKTGGNWNRGERYKGNRKGYGYKKY